MQLHTTTIQLSLLFYFNTIVYDKKYCPNFLSFKFSLNCVIVLGQSGHVYLFRILIVACPSIQSIQRPSIFIDEVNYFLLLTCMIIIIIYILFNIYYAKLCVCYGVVTFACEMQYSIMLRHGTVWSYRYSSGIVPVLWRMKVNKTIS